MPLKGSCKITSLLADLLGQLREQVVGISSDSSGNGEELNHVDSPLATFILRHKRLGTANTRRDLMLSKSGCLARFDQKRAQSEMLGTVD